MAKSRDFDLGKAFFPRPTPPYQSTWIWEKAFFDGGGILALGKFQIPLRPEEKHRILRKESDLHEQGPSVAR